MNAEFIFIQNGLCMRAYQEYDGEVPSWVTDTAYLGELT